MIEQPDQPDRKPNPHAFSLAEMIVGLTAVAAMFGIWQTSTSVHDVDEGMAGAAIVFGVIVGAAVGFVSGMTRGPSSSVVGLFAGGITGGIGGAATSVLISWRVVALACVIVCGTAAVCGRLVRKEP